MPDNHSAYYEQRLQREIESIESRIKELTAEKFALQRQLMKARLEDSGLQDVNRKNSITRIMIENRIKEALEQSSQPLLAKTLLAEARFVNFELKENTFRTHLHRMKAKGIIKKNSNSHRWQLVGADKKVVPLFPEKE